MKIIVYRYNSDSYLRSSCYFMLINDQGYVICDFDISQQKYPRYSKVEYKLTTNEFKTVYENLC